MTDYFREAGGYRAPELLQKGSLRTQKVDIWALGCLALEIVTRRKTFINDFDIYAFVYEDSGLSIPSLSHLGKGWSFWQRVIPAMLQIKEAERPTAGALHAEFWSQWQNPGVGVHK